MTEHHSHKFCVAPMMDGTDRHCRYFHRLISKHARLYSEMITADAAIHGDREYLLGFDESEQSVALQLGGSDPAKLSEAARIGEGVGYDEINLNVGCPSDRVQSGAFGACLMKEPTLVADCVAAMHSAVDVPVTVKCRIGVDDQDPEESLFGFVDRVTAAGCDIFIVHARKAWLDGLSPKENRTLPPLDYDLVARLKRERPGLSIILNGGIETVRDAQIHLGEFDGVMLGRAAYGQPYILNAVDRDLFEDDTPARTREQVVEAMSEYLKQQFERGVRPHSIIRHMIGLYHGERGARGWRRYLTENARHGDPAILDRAADELQLAICTAA
ncbi:MAG: tRNA dihydrouridine(20/20a) synthase DusA [Marinicaulis sp.]|nr:tRNA dihydrouridine(20/20a) synthase DusA [Marinicaulis sp.]